MTIKIVLPKNGTSHPAVANGTKIYTDSGEEIQGVVACDIRIRPSEAITAILEVTVSEVENLERLKGVVSVIEGHPHGGLECVGRCEGSWMLPRCGERVVSNQDLERMKSEFKK